MNNKLKPAIIGGVVVGLLSAIPIVNALNVCCCLWAVLGGVLASYLYIKASATPVKPGDGAVLGLLAGVVGALIYIVIGIPISILMGATMTGWLVRMMEGLDPRQAEMFRQQMLASQSIIQHILSGLFSAFLLLIFSTLGGLLGIPIFEKRKGGSDLPPPPQGFGGEPPHFGGEPPPGGYGSQV
jgi:hypothetical protein